jgi:hypothetical protein
VKEPEQIHYKETISITFTIPIDRHAGITQAGVDILLYDIADDIEENVLGGKFAERLAGLGVMVDVNRHNVL